MASFPSPPPPPSQPPPVQRKQSKRFRDLYNNTDSQISQAVGTLNLNDHPPAPFMPPLQVEGLAPGPAQEENLMDIQSNFGLEPKKKSQKVQDFLENSNNNNSQISLIEFLQAQSVSTGIGLSLEPNSALLGLVADDLDRELQRQDAETDRYIKLHGEQLRQSILHKVRATQLMTISYTENKVLQILREKEVEVEGTKKKNMQLELLVKRLSSAAHAWKLRADYNENMIKAYAQNTGSKEGCEGDSEVNDTARNFQVDSSEMKKLMRCKVCCVNEVCMLLLPCKHLGLCKECEPKLSICLLSTKAWRFICSGLIILQSSTYKHLPFTW